MSDLAEAEATVLVVDDEDAVRRLFHRALARRGYHVIEAVNGDEALRHIRSGAHAIDIVLLDNGLPDRSGLDVVSALRQDDATSTLPVILVTGQGGVADRVNGLQAGADDFVAKPVDLDELAARVEAQLRGRNAWLRRVADGLHERATIAASLAAVEPANAPSLVADHVAEVLLRLRGAVRAGVIELHADGRATLLGLRPAAPRQDLAIPLSSSAAAAIHRSLGQGAWLVEPGPRQLRPLPGAGWQGGPIACAALHDTRGAVAVLAVESAAPGGGPVAARADSLLSAAIDLAPVVENLMVTSLHRRDRTSEASSELRDILDQRRFHPVYQPIIDLGTNAIVGFEALTRFDDDTRPDVRFLEAERLGLGVELQRLTRAAAMAGAGDLPPGAYLSVNASASALVTGGVGPLPPTTPARQLVIEVTEHERVDDYTQLRGAIEQLGPDVKVSVDDAGSGYASLRHVLALHPDYVKLDRDWVSGIDSDPVRQTLILGLVRFVEEFGAQIVAEGIETAAELAAARRLGVHLAQGDLLGRPAPAPGVDAAVAAVR